MSLLNVNTPGVMHVGKTLAQLGALADGGAALKVALVQYAQAAQGRQLAAGFSFAVPGASPPVSLAVAADAQSLAFINGLALWASANPSGTTPWVDNAGTVTPLSAAEASALAAAAMAFVQASFAALASVAAGIASGAITTTAQIDAAF